MTTLSVEKTIEERIEALEAALYSAPRSIATDSGATDLTAADSPATDKVCMVVFSGDLDKILAALTMATGAAAMGTDVCLFFTFWATTALRRRGSFGAGRPPLDGALSRMLPRGTRGLKLSRMHMGGIGTAMIKRRMRTRQFASCDELLEMAKESGVQIRVCDMSMDLMGIHMDELIDYPGLERCGVATFMENAIHSCVTLLV